MFSVTIISWIRLQNDQAVYQKENHRVTHDQTIKGKQKPQNRVFYYHGTHDLVGENCIKIPLKMVFKPSYNKKEIEVKTYAEAGEALFLGWKNSPGHYKNMIGPGYDVYGLGFSFDPDSNYLYCTQVFCRKTICIWHRNDQSSGCFWCEGSASSVLYDVPDRTSPQGYKNIPGGFWEVILSM